MTGFVCFFTGTATEYRDQNGCGRANIPAAAIIQERDDGSQDQGGSGGNRKSEQTQNPFEKEN